MDSPGGEMCRHFFPHHEFRLIIIRSMPDSVHNPDQSVAVGAPTLAHSGGVACAVNLGVLVLMGTNVACVDVDTRGGPRAKLWPCA